MEGSRVDILLSIAEKIGNELKEKGYTTCINITGGEPLLDKKSLTSLISFLDQNHQVEELMIITNGLLLNEAYLKDLERFSKLTTIKLSLEGATATTNDLIRGKGTYAAIVDKIQLLKTKSFLKTVIMFTLNKNNLSELELMFTLAEELRLDGLIFERFIPEGQGKNLKNMVLDKNDWKNFLQRLIIECDLDTTPEDLLPYRAFWIQFGSNWDVLGSPCNLKEALCIMPDGTLYPCRRFIYPLGNILKDGLWSVLDRSKILKEVTTHQHLQGKCHQCIVNDCHGCRALCYSLYHDPYHEDPQCFRE